jgi:hypothetical protein
MDVSWMTQYTPWLVIIVLCCVHLVLYKGVKRFLSGWLEAGSDTRHIFMMVPLPWWIHFGLFHLSFLITIILVWLIALI